MKIIGELDAEDFLTIQNMINLKNLDLEEVNLTELPTKAFYKMKTIENLILPHTLTIINDSEFYQNSLKSIIISSNVETIGEYAFYECPLKSINIPASVKAINKAAFMNCSSLATITFSKGSMLTKICGGKGFLSHGEKYYYGAFANCTALTSIEIPANVEIIEEAAFKNCTALTTVTFENNSSLKTICGATYEMDSNGGIAIVEVKANIDYEYEIGKDCKDWVTLKETRALQTTMLSFDVAQNTDFEKREGTITVFSDGLSETITIYQAGEEPTIVLTQNKYDVSGDGETIKVEINSNVDFQVTIPSDVDWIKETWTRAISTHTKYFKIATNSPNQSRSAEILFTILDDVTVKASFCFCVTTSLVETDPHVKVNVAFRSSGSLFSVTSKVICSLSPPLVLDAVHQDSPPVSFH